MNWINVNEDYLDYLRETEGRIPRTDYGTDKYKPDTDSDGLIDKYEVEIKTDPLKLDTDGDGLKDGSEIALDMDPLKADSKGDGIKDGEREFTTNIKLIDLEEKSNFEDEIKTDDRWYEVISSQLIGALPIFLQYDLHLFDYYLTYEETKGIYGSNFDASGDYSIILLAYNISLSKLMVISDLEISVVI